MSKSLLNTANNENDENSENHPFEPPQASWRLPMFIAATAKEIAAKTVECKTCPVFMLCEVGEGGTGWVCPKCSATGVYVDQPEQSGGRLPIDVLVLDCGKHKFEKKEESKQITKCALCSGGLMELEILNKGTANHYIVTAYAKVTAAERQKTLKDAHVHWKKHYGDLAKKAKKK